MRSRPTLAAALAALLLTAGLAGAQQPIQGPKRPLTYDAYDSWHSIQGTTLARDGAWVAYALVPQDGDSTLVVRHLRAGAEHRHPRGKDPRFTADGRFVAFTIAPLKAEVDEARKAGKKDDDLPKSGFGVMNVATGEVFAVDRVKSFQLAKEGSSAVAYLLEAPDKQDRNAEKKDEDARPKKNKKKEPGTDLIVRQLAAGSFATIPGVVEYTWNESGSLLAYTVSSKSGVTDGAFARRSSDGATTALLTGTGFYNNIVFDDAGTQVAFTSDSERHSLDPAVARFALYHWSDGSPRATLVASASTAGMPDGFGVSEHGKVTFAKDGTAVFFGVSPAPRPAPDDGAEPVKVDVWTFKDPFLQPMQKARAEEEEKRSYLAVVHLKDRRFVPLGSPDLPDLGIGEGVPVLLGASDVPYRQLLSWDGEYHDYFLVNPRGGTKQTILQKLRFDARLSPAGAYIFYFDAEEQDWMTVRVADGRKTNLTAALPARFSDEEWDTPENPRPYGAAGWLEGDRAILVYDRYDIWEIRPDGSGARPVTHGMGRTQKITFRYQKTDLEEKAIPPLRPLLLSATNERTRATGFYRVAAGGAPEPLVMMDEAFANVQKARDADVFVFTRSRFDKFPDLWHSGPAFKDMKRISDANPQQAEYKWGRAELIDYKNADGRPLRAVLITPEDFDPSRKYPLMVYIYETLSEGVHTYRAPAPGHNINIPRYVSNGYVVLLPDIVYQTGYPGESALKCVVPAVQTVVAKGFVDPERVGIQGHSWGGYQITYMITRTNIFRAVQAGASVSNMVSAYGGIRWGTGRSRAFQYEKTQSRIGAPPWDRTLEYIENSPIFWVEKVRTPYLTIHNDEDDAVPWYQGIEFFSAMRRLGKEAYMFVYNGEKHGLRQRHNQKHWTIHMDEYFDHYLQGAPRPEWMEKGVSYLERGARDVSGYYKRKATDRGPGT
jgi:dienelactone hydrolase